MATVAIVGAGVMGSALSFPLADNGHTVHLIGTHLDDDIIRQCQATRVHPRLQRQLPASVKPFFVTGLGQALDGVELVISGVSSPGVHWFARTVGPHLRPALPVLAVTKGLEATAEGDLRILPDVVADELPASLRGQVPIAAIGGPCIAGELAARRHSAVVFGSRRTEVLGRLAAFLQTSYYHVWQAKDVVGLEVCAAMKNAYALGVGLAAGLLERAGGPDGNAFMHNLAAALFAQAAVEMVQMVRLLGSSPEYVTGLPGVGDMFVTVQGGRTMRLGRLLGRGLTLDAARREMVGETLESVEIITTAGGALPRLIERGLVRPEDFPLLRFLYRVLHEGSPMAFPWEQFFAIVGLRRDG
ncbi:MAG: glycerol-3-phosphate dehydrogenase [Anaerolineae bacterium]|nr:glycerol-3-phosphate dehydrogenase [Anaerolineae bacterium]